MSKLTRLPKLNNTRLYSLFLKDQIQWFLVLIVIIASVLFLFFNKGIKLSVEYRDYQQVNIVFQNEVGLSAVKDDLQEIKRFEQIERVSPNEYNVKFLELDDQTREKLSTELNGVSSVQVYQINKVLPRLSNIAFYSVLVIVGVLALFTLVIKKTKSSQLQAGMVVSSMMTLAMIILLQAVLASIITSFTPLDREILIFELIVAAIIFLDHIELLHTINTNYELSQRNVKQLVANYSLDNMKLLITVVSLMPFAVISNSALELMVILTTGLFLILAKNLVVMPVFATIWDKGILQLPVIKDTKWASK